MGAENRERAALDIGELYRPPAVDEPALEAPSASGTFYVVSPRKFVLLFLLTLGMYTYYWFYEHWRRYRSHSGERLSPFWRAVFSVFFVHRLFRGMDAAAVKADAHVAWSAGDMASGYVVLSIAGHVLTRLSTAAEAPWLDLVSVVCSLGTVYPMYAAQRVANVVAGDAQGSSNQVFTPRNYVFMLLGVLFWALFFLGLTIEGDSIE